jgi:hypothetical protein
VDAGVVAKPTLDSLGSAQQIYDTIDNVTAKLKHDAPSIASNKLPIEGLQVRADRRTHHLNIAKPSFSRGLQGSVDGWVEAPDIAHLEQQALVTRFVDQFTKGSEFIPRRLLQVQVLVGGDRRPPIRQLFTGVTFHDDEID